MRSRRAEDITPTKVRRQAVSDARSSEWRWWPPRWPFKIEKPVFPPADQEEPSEYELHIREIAEADLGLLEENWHRDDLKLKRDYCMALARLTRARAAFGKENTEAISAEEALKGAQEDLHELKPAAVSEVWKWIGLIAIGVTEFPLNSIIFRIIGEDDSWTYLLAAGIGIVIPVLAHFFGHSLRQDVKTRSDKAVVIALPIVLLTTLVGISVMRATFFEAEAGLMQKTLHISMSAPEATAIFFSLNLAMFFAASLVSYFGSVGDKETRNQRLQLLSAMRRSFEKESAEKESAGRELADASDAYHTARANRQKTFDAHSAGADRLSNMAESLMQQYRYQNIAARRDGKRPPCFLKDLIGPAIPVDLAKGALTWDCHVDLTGAGE